MPTFVAFLVLADALTFWSLIVWPARFGFCKLTFLKSLGSELLPKKFSVSAACFLAVDHYSGEGFLYFLSELRPLFGVIIYKSLCLRLGILRKLIIDAALTLLFEVVKPKSLCSSRNSF